MALWAKVQQLPSDSVHLQQIKSRYDWNLFPIEVRHGLAQFIEDKFGTAIVALPDNVAHEKDVALINQLIREIKKKAESSDFLTKLKLTEAARGLKQQFSHQPLQLFEFIHQCLTFEMNQLQDAGMDFTLPISNSASEISSNLEDLLQRTRATAEETRRLDQEKQAFNLQYHEFTRVRADVDHHNIQGTHDVPGLKSIDTKQELLQLNVIERVHGLRVLLERITQNLRQTYELLLPLHERVIHEELMNWKRNQQLACNGGSFSNNLDQIQVWCECLVEIIHLNWQQIKKVAALRQNIDLDPLVVDVLQRLLTGISHLLSSLVKSTFIVEKQPTQVLLKKNKKFDATVRSLVGGKLNIHNPEVTVTIISESHANLLVKNNQLLEMVNSSGEIFPNTGPMKHHPSTRKLSVSFEKMQLTKLQRAEKKGAESVIEEKFSLLFQSQFSSGELIFKVWTLSLPVTVIVHAHQESQARATVIWDNAFSEPSRCLFQVPDKVPWTKVKDVLSQKFMHETKRGLTDANLHYLAEIAFRGSYDETTNPILSWSQFCKEPLSGRKFTFWEWFFAIMKLTKNHLDNLWVDGAITGFLKKEKAEEMLSRCPVGTFLIRFSESELESVTVALKSDTQKVSNLQPFTSQELKTKSLADRVADYGFLVNLYPGTPKELLFQKYCSPPLNPSPGYVLPKDSTLRDPNENTILLLHSISNSSDDSSSASYPAETSGPPSASYPAETSGPPSDNMELDLELDLLDLLDADIPMDDRHFGQINARDLVNLA